MFKAFLIKYGEIGIKGKNRHLFEDALVQQIKYALRPVEGDFLISKEQGRIYIEALGEYDDAEAVERLACVFGIVGICPSQGTTAFFPAISAGMSHSNGQKIRHFETEKKMFRYCG